MPAHFHEASTHKGDIAKTVKGPEFPDGIKKHDVFDLSFETRPSLALIPRIRYETGHFIEPLGVARRDDQDQVGKLLSEPGAYLEQDRLLPPVGASGGN